MLGVAVPSVQLSHGGRGTGPVTRVKCHTPTVQFHRPCLSRGRVWGQWGRCAHGPPVRCSLCAHGFATSVTPKVHAAAPLCRRQPLVSLCRQEGDSAGVRGRPSSLLLRPACARGPWSQRFWVRGCCSGSPGRTPGCFEVACPFLGLAARYKTQGWFSLVGIG